MWPSIFMLLAQVSRCSFKLCGSGKDMPCTLISSYVLEQTNILEQLGQEGRDSLSSSFLLQAKGTAAPGALCHSSISVWQH